MGQYADLIAAGYEAFTKGDLTQVLALLHPEIDAQQSEDVPWGGTYKGLAEFAQFMGKLREYVDTVVVVDEIVEAGDTVVMIGRSKGKVVATGREFDLRALHVWHMEDGKARRFEVYLDTPAMLEALRAE